VIARWFFMAQTTGRYISSPESALESDLQRISDLAGKDGRSFADELDRQVRANFTNDYWQISLPNRLDTAASRFGRTLINGSSRIAASRAGHHCPFDLGFVA
jgi:hypothetical protein